MSKRLLLVFVIGFFLTGWFSSCSDNDDPGSKENKVTVKFSAVPAVEGTLDMAYFEGMKAVFTEVRNQEKTECLLDNTGVGMVSLNKGTYNVALEEKVKNKQGDPVVVSVRIENFSVNEDGQEIIGKANTLPESALGKGFIFSEIFFNGETNARMMHPDQYFVIFNPTSEDLYADGLCIAPTNQPSAWEKEMWYDKYYPTQVPIMGFITIPGNGKEHLVKAGEKLVIAFTAINHNTEDKPNSVDLSGADFEIYTGPDSELFGKDVDNPEVPNVLVTHNPESFVGGFYFHPRGFYAPLMFKLENGEKATVEKFYKDNLSKAQQLVPADEEAGTPASTIEVTILSVPTDMILDGVQTGLKNYLKTRAIPESVDRGAFLVSGCHRQELAIRKEILVGDRVFYQDTNNSDEDFVLDRKGQNAFPVGWRDKK